MTASDPDAAGPPPERPLTIEERRWLHDKYQELDHSEAELASYRSSFIAVVTTALVAALVYAVANVLPRGDLVFAITVTGLALLGGALATLWVVILWRTTAAQLLFREAAERLEALAPPIEPHLPTTIELRPGRSVAADLTRPYEMHRRRFVASKGIPWIDRINPSGLSNAIPIGLLVAWAVTTVGVWAWYLGWV